MTDQDQCDPLSFKGQMAARYRERLSMGFTLGPAYFEAEQAQIRPRSSPDTPGSEPPHDTQEEAQLSGRSGRPTVTRSRSSLGEHLADAGKPSMKELITKFERRSHTASQLRQSKHVEEDGGRMARDAWESNYPRIKMELDPSAPTSSSSSDTVGSKSLTTMSKTAYAKTSRAALSLNSDIIKQQIHRNSDSPHPQSGNKITEERKKFGARDELNNANSNVFRDLEPAQTPKRQMSDVSTAPSASRPKEGTASFAAAGQQNLSAKSHEQEDHKMSSEEQDPAKTQPLRVSLRGIAARRKMKAENKYVVHKKEWGKLLPTSKQAPGGAALILTEPGVQNTRPKSAIERDTTPKCSRRDVVQDLSLQNLLCDASTASANTHKKSERRSSLRQIASRSEIKVNDEKKKASAVERYLQFLKSSHPPQHSSSALKMSERYELRKASRPPTPYRTAHARRGNSGSSKNNLLNLKDSNQSIPSRGSTPTAAEALQQKRKLEKEARGTLLSHFRPRSKPLPSSGREIAADHSMGELIVNAAHSSSNSVDSNNYGDTRKASPYSHVGHRRPDQLFSQFASTAKTPEKLGHTSGKVSPLASGNAIQLTHVDRVRPDAGGKMAHDEDQSYHAFLRTRSPSSGKASHAGNPKLNILQRTSQREPTPASPRDGESLAGLGNSVHIHAGSDRKGNLTSIEPSDFWSHILTADELADNDLIPSHLRDRKTHGPSGHITRLFSSSEESNSAMVEPPGKITPKLSPFTKVSHLPTRDSAVEKSAVIDTIGTQYIAKQKRLNLNRDFFPRGEGRSPRVQTHIPLYGRRSGEGNRLFHLNEKNRGISQGQYVPYGSRAELIGESGYNRYTNSNLSRTSGGQPNTWGDSKNRLADKLLKGSRINMGGVNSSPGGLNAQIPHVTPGTGGLNPQYSQVPHVNHQPPHVSPASSNPAPPYVFQTENTGYSQYRDARDHAAVSPAMAAPAPTDGQSKKTQDVVLQADAVPPFLTGASTMQHKESPAKSKQDIRPAVPGAAKDSAKFSGGLMESGPILQQDAIVGTGDIQLKGMKFAHFGQTGGLNEDAVGLDKDSSLFASPQKKKRKVEKNKKMKKKKKKVKDDGDYDNVDVAGSQNVPKSSKEKRGQKEKTKENKEKTDANEKHEKDDKSKNHEKHEKKHEKHKEHHEKGGKLDKPDKNENVEIRDKFEKAAILDKMENMEKNENAEKHGKLIRRKSVENMPKQKKKERREMSPALDTRSVLSGDNSNCSVKHDKSSSVKKDLSPLKLSALGTVSRLTYEPTDRFPCRSRIPHLKAKTFAPRKKLDRLIQYRRWREAMLDCLHPSRLPLTESFRKSLDSAVMEEWALHCWQPTHDLCVDSHGIWWSASYQEVTDANMTESLLGEGRLFCKERFLDVTTRLPYMKVGPLRFLHVTYLLMVVACVTIGHFGVLLYHCAWDEYEYYCSEDDVDCLVQMLSQSVRQ